MMRSIIVGCLVFNWIVAAIYAQPSTQAIFTEYAPVIDGSLNDSQWTKASVVSDFYQREPAVGMPASEPTTFLFLYDRQHLYIGIRCEADKNEITAKELARDVSLGDDDRIQVILDTYLDGRNGYWFQIGPRGSLGDALISENGKGFNKAWDGLFDGRAKIDGEGWTAELVIPFKTLAFKRGLETWGLKLIRYIKKRSETDYWPATTLDADRFQISDAGRITGLKGITQGIGLDLVPYVTTGMARENTSDSRYILQVGGDLFYQVTPSLKASVTLNTDFAQTEVDLKQINLTRFSLFYPEKRDFFLDGSNYFNFAINGDQENPQNTMLIPYFSRRVGLDPEGNPVAVTYGGKFTGQVGKWSLGLMHIRDENSYSEPGYSAGRVVRNFGSQSSAGFIATHGNSLAKGENTLMGFDIRLAGSKVFGSKNAIVHLYGLKSFDAENQGNDAALGAEVNYPNDLVNFRAGYMQIGEQFRAGLGFVPRVNVRSLYGSFRLGPRPDMLGILQVKSGVSWNHVSKLTTGAAQSIEFNLQYGEVNFLSGDILLIGSRYQFEWLDADFLLFDQYTIKSGRYHFWNHFVQLISARHRSVWAGMKLARGGFYSGYRTDWLLQAGYKIAVPVFAGIDVDNRFVRLDSAHFVTRIYRLNLNFLFSPSLSLYSFFQYDNQSGTIGWQSRFQWIVRPGRELFFTWNSPRMDPFDRFSQEAYEARLKANFTFRF